MTFKIESKQLLWQNIFKDEQLIMKLTINHAAACSKASIDPLQESADENAITIESSKWGPIRLLEQQHDVPLRRQW